MITGKKGLKSIYVGAYNSGQANHRRLILCSKTLELVLRAFINDFTQNRWSGSGTFVTVGETRIYG